MLNRIKEKWIRFWMKYAGTDFLGRIATRNAELFAPPYYSRAILLSWCNPKGYVSTKAIIYHDKIIFGKNIFIGDRVRVYKDQDGGEVKIGDASSIHDDTFLQTGQEGKIIIGANTNINPRCQLSAYKSSIIIGNGVNIAPNCAFYPYDHGTKAGTDIFEQPLTSKGDIVIKDFAWLGVGVIVISGGKVGEGAVIGAGSVVNTEIPDFAIAVGNPAKVIRYRE
jgi:acetyltransferase-like isoleucine patch superfamily enzyme